MNLLRHGVASLIIFVSLIGIIITIHDGLQKSYGFTDDDVKTVTNFDGITTTGNIMDQFESMLIMKSINSIERSLVGLTSGNFVDLVGGLATAGIGVLQAVLGLITAPLEIIYIISEFYGGKIPAAIITGLAGLVSVYAFFILLSAYLKKDV